MLKVDYEVLYAEFPKRLYGPHDRGPLSSGPPNCEPARDHDGARRASVLPRLCRYGLYAPPHHFLLDHLVGNPAVSGPTGPFQGRDAHSTDPDRDGLLNGSWFEQAGAQLDEFALEGDRFAVAAGYPDLPQESDRLVGSRSPLTH